jgi:hypothetical protein
MGKIKIWEIINDTNAFRSFNFYDTKQLLSIEEKLDQGNFSLIDWVPIRVELFEDELSKETNKEVSDFMQLPGYTVNKKAKELYEELVSETVMFLPIITPVGEYWTMNIKLVNCLDQTNSEIKRFPNGNILRVIKYSFSYEKVRNLLIFRIPEMEGKALYVTEKFKEIYEKNELTGLIFLPIVE